MRVAPVGLLLAGRGGEDFARESFEVGRDDASITHGRPGVSAWSGGAGVAHVRYDNVLVETLPGCSEPSWSAGTSAEASAYGPPSERRSTAMNHLCLLLIPIGATVLLRVLRRRRVPPQV